MPPMRYTLEYNAYVLGVPFTHNNYRHGMKELFHSCKKVKNTLHAFYQIQCPGAVSNVSSIIDRSEVVELNAFFWKKKSLRPSGALWRQRSGSTLAQVMAFCMTAPSHYLNQC